MILQGLDGLYGFLSAGRDMVVNINDTMSEAIEVLFGADYWSDFAITQWKLVRLPVLSFHKQSAQFAFFTKFFFGECEATFNGAKIFEESLLIQCFS